MKQLNDKGGIDMEAPDKIYLHEEDFTRIYTQPSSTIDDDIEYIRKDALLGWINEMRKKHRGFTDTELVVTLDKLTEKINSF